MKSRTSGFTLVELMVVVAVVAILASIAYPSYQEHLRRSRRADGKTVLLNGVQFMERIYTERGAYNWKKNSDGSYSDASTLEDLGFPDSLKSSPREGSDKYYTIGLDGALSATAFTLKASPMGAQAGDSCGDLKINQAGTKTVTGTASADTCWNR